MGYSAQGVKFCPECGKKIEIEMDFTREPISFREKGVRLYKRCRNCKYTLDSVLAKAE